MKKKIVEVRPGDAKGRVIAVFDDGTSIGIDREFAGKAAIRVGREIEVESLDRLVREHNYERCYEAALHFLEFRSRSEEELRRQLLIKRKFDTESAARAIDKLKEAGLIDDRAFAEAWMRDRISYRPKSRLMIKRELLQKGVDFETASQVTDSVDDAESACNAALKKAKLLRNLEYTEFYRRLAAYLGRRGYGGDAIHTAVARSWESISGGLSEK